ncbi:aminoglycoside phosphotransferase family protein [Cytobacillus sp. IB215316]|uniref:aminoglycoside phosphotransferase family protein n=1 Tax=Cytobacillus sp. IB215316 TaxID=3097354 RepID=UPI002A0AC62D|nr:aminoglycoside phosphotransferase family protein [Cytobacillus sp. IB215316]MDX8362395.1 aminoglycoside phosphotransferase family protein [Cytobacillus sp. IB215316]
MELQDHFVKTVHLYFKEEGVAWLQRLPELIRDCEQKWHLKIKEPFTLSINYVAAAIMNDGREVVVKICIPGEGFLDEIEALTLFGGKGMVQLIDFDKDKGIMILEKVSPGHTLAEIVDDAKACRLAANVIKKLSIRAPKETRIASTLGREEKLRNLIKEHPEGFGPISQHTLEVALKVFTYLNRTIEQHFLLHGDFHHYNVLSFTDEIWTAIDPKGLVGEIEYDLIQFLLNKLPDQNAYDVVAKRVDILTQELKLNKERLLLWGYCHTVLATSWTVDDDGTYDDKFYQAIDIFHKLYEANYGMEIEALKYVN